MNEQDDRILAAWLAEGPERGPQEGLERTLAVARRTAQRPAWSFPGRWLPARLAGDGASAPRGALYALLLLALLLLVALAVIAVAGSRPRVPAPFGPAGNGELAYESGGAIYLANGDGSGGRPIAGGLGIDQTPVFAPDGTRFVFWSHASPDDPLALYVASADGSDVRRISGDLAIHANVGYWPSWSPDSRRVVFHSEESGVQRLYVVPVDGSAAPVAITGADASRWAPAWSPSGEWIAFGQSTAGPSPMDAVAVVRPDGTGLRVLHEQPSTPDEGSFAESLTWSPDSTGVAYVRGHAYRRGPAFEPPDYKAYLVVVSLQGDEVPVYTEPSGWAHLPAFSPDGTHLAFVRGEQAHTVMVVGVDGSDPRVVAECDGLLDDLLTWSPDGLSILAACPGHATLVPLGDPHAASPLPLPSDVRMIDWQRTAR